MTSRRRFVAGSAALLAITATLVFGGALAAQAAVDVTSLENGSHYAWDADGLVVSGTTDDPATTVTVVDDATDQTLCVDDTLGELTWTCTVALAPSDSGYDLRADQGEGPPDFVTIFIDLPQPVVTGPSLVPAGGTASFTGVDGYPGGNINVLVTDPADTSLFCNSTVGTGGTWACDIPFDAELPPGSTVTTNVTQSAAGLTGTASTTHVFSVEAPDFAITSPADGASIPWTAAPSVVVEGTTPDTFSPITVYLDGEDELCQVTEPTENWSCDAEFALDPGTHFLTAQQYPHPDSVVTITVTVSAPVLECGFRPNGGFSASSAQTLAYLDIYRLSPYSGGGSGSGGSGGSGGSEGGGGSGLAEQGFCNGDPGVQFAEDALFQYESVSTCGNPCTVASLPPGDYEVYHQVASVPVQPGYNTAAHSYVFRVPTAPSITGAIGTTNSVVLRGQGVAGDELRVVRSNGNTLCTTTVTGSGAWACQFPKSSASSARVIDIDAQSGAMSAYSAARSIPIFVAPPTLAVEPPVTLVSWFLEFGGDLMNLKPGDSFTLNVSGMPEGTEIEIWMHSTPVLIGTATGTGLPMQLQLTVPEDIESGPHEIEMIGVTPLGTHYYFTSDAMVTGGALPGEKTEDKPDDTAGGDGPGGGAGDRANPAAPSGITGALAPLSAVAANPATIAIAGGLALALLFLVALPTELLNSSLSSNTSRLGRVYGAVDGAMTKAQDWLIKVTRSRAIAAGILVILIAIIYGFVDPDFGFDLVSLRLVLSLGIAFFLLTFVASWISGLIIRRAWGAMGVVAMQPSIILFAVVGVIVARVLDFSPGFLVGVAIGLELVAASKTVTAKAVFVQLGVVTGLALAAWVVYSFFTPGDDFLGMLVEDSLVAVTAEGLTGALIAVFPLKFLDGRELWEVSKRLWVAAFLIVSTAFALLVLPTAIEGTDVRDYGVWLLVFAVFGLVSLAVWIVFVRADAKAARAEGEKVDA